MDIFTTVTGPAVPLMRANIDTDVIIRIDRLTALPKDALGQHALESLRYRANGTADRQLDPDCVLNDPRFAAAPILLAGANFGCGSSREGAVWALQGMGVRCVIAPSFGDIFFNNCFQNGVLPIRMAPTQVDALAALAAGGAALTVDLGQQLLHLPDGSVWTFHVEPLRRESLLQGLDEIGLTLQHMPAIDAWESADRAARPWNWTVKAS
jgi:3-isopropylmalate/(R)-2-methylmalate dehydratase small subunit